MKTLKRRTIPLILAISPFACLFRLSHLFSNSHIFLLIERKVFYLCTCSSPFNVFIIHHFHIFRKLPSSFRNYHRMFTLPESYIAFDSKEKKLSTSHRESQSCQFSSRTSIISIFLCMRVLNV